MTGRRIEKDEVLRIAKLARIEVDDAELERLATDLGRIVAYVDQLAELDVGRVSPTAHANRAGLPTRADEPLPSLDRDVVMAQAPATADGAFAVPAFVDEG